MAKSYTVQAPLKRNGKRYEPGKTVTIDDDKEAQELVENGTLAKPAAKSEKEAEGKK